MTDENEQPELPTDPEELKELILKKLAEGIGEATEHHVGRDVTEGVTSKISTQIHAMLTSLQDEGHFPELNLAEISVGVHKTDAGKVIVTFPPELQPLFEEANRRRAAAIEESHKRPDPTGYSAFYDRVYKKRDTPQGDAHGWIQWKGTDVCMDMHCECGHHGHLDDEFAYFYECVKCGARYAVGQVVKLIKLEGEDLEFTKDDDFKRDPQSLEK